MMRRSLCLGVIASTLTFPVFGYTTVYSAAAEKGGYSKITQKQDNVGYLWENGTEAGLSDCDYVAKHQTRTPANQDATFTGHSFTVDNATLADKGLGHTLTWSNEGLFLKKGTWQQWDVVVYPARSTFAGTVTVTAPESAPFGIYPTGDGTTANYHLAISAKFKSAVGTAAYLTHNDAYFKTKGNVNCQHLYISGDTTEYYGAFIARTNGILEVSGSTFAGTLKAEGGSSVTFSNGCLKVGTLIVGDNASVTAKLRYDADAKKIVPFAVTNAFTFAAGAPKIKVVLPDFTEIQDVPTKRMDLVRFDFDGVPSLDAFDIVIDSQAERHCYLSEPQVDADTRAIYVDVEPYVSMLGDDPSGKTSLYDLVGNGAYSTPTNWTDGVLPHADRAYLVRKKLRTSPDNFVDPSKAHLDIFPGKKIVFDSGTLALKSRGFEATNAVFLGAWVSAYGSPNTQCLRGNFKILRYGQSSTTFESQDLRTMEIEASLSGNGDVVLWNGGASTGPCPIKLLGDNSKFSGRFRIAGNAKKDLSFFYPCVSITNANALGAGSYAGELDGEAIRVYDGGKLRADEDVSFYDPLRCFHLSTGGRIGVAEGKEFEILSRIKMGTDVENSGFVKEDAGTLTLGNSWIGFGGKNSGNPMDGTNNVISVNGGTLKVGHAEAVNGARIVLAEGTRLMVGPNLGAAGIRNVKTAVPFATTASDGLVRMALELAEAPQALSFSVALCTVTDEAAAKLHGKVSVAKPCKGYRATVRESFNGDGTVTLFADCERTGLLLIVK